MQTMLAYAESADGVSWVKPDVETVEYNGSRDNNLVFGLDLSLGRHAIGAYVFKDLIALPDEAYKLVHMGGDGGRFYVWRAVSPDGLRWRALERPLLSDYMSDTQTVVGFDADMGVYVGYSRGWTAHEHGSLHHRHTIAYAETERFESWPKPRTMVTADMHDGPDTDIYTSADTPWPSADAHLMFPAFYRRNPDVTEVHMMTSRDGRAWQRPLTQAVIPAEEPGSGSEGGVYAGCGPAGRGVVTACHAQTSVPQPGELRRPHVAGVGRQDGLVSL